MAMTELKEIIETRLTQLNLGAVEAATKAGIERTFIRDIVVGRKKSVRADKMGDLARALQLDQAALSQGRLKPVEEQENRLVDVDMPVGSIAVTGKIAANTWLSVDEMDFGYDDVEYVPSVGGYPPGWQFALKIEGNCLNKIAQHGDRLVCLNTIMANISISDDDLAIVERKRFDGQMVERTAKRVRRTSAGFELWPESNDPAHQEPIRLYEDHLGEDIQVIGKVLWILRKP